jgi:tetratricopeptide (TPR) repeat protein
MQMRENLLIILVLFSAVIVCYSSVLNAGFVWDDEHIILQNPLIRAPLGAFQMFKQDIVNSGFTYTAYYRPVQILSYAIDYRLGGMSSFVYHFTNIFLHFLNSVLVFLLAYKLSREKAVALLTSFIFAVHPAQTGAVAYISGRTDLLFFLFGFLSMYFYVLFRERKEYAFLVAGVVSLCISFFSKEAAIIFPFLCLFMDLVILRKRKGFELLYHIPNFAAVGACVFVHSIVSGGGYGVIFSGLNGLAARALQAVKMTGDFLAVGVFPYCLRMRHSVSAAGEKAVLALILLAGIVAAIVFLKDRRRILLFGAGFFLIALVPFLLVVGSFQVFAEHWMYLASFGLFLFISSALLRIYSSAKPIVRGALLVIVYAGLVLYPAGTMVQNHHWVDDVSLSDQVLGFSDQDAVALHYKAVALLKSGKKEKSLDIMKDVTKYHPTDARAWYLRGRMELAAGNTQEAESAFNKALEIQPGYDNAYFGLALATLAENKEKEGMGYIGRALEVNPRHPEAIMFLCMAYSKSGDPQKAVIAAEKAHEVYPYNYDILVNLGTAYTRAGRTQEGAFMYLEATRLYPQEVMPYYNLGYVFYASGLKQDAMRWLKEAVMVDPGFTPAIDLIRKIREEEKS